MKVNTKVLLEQVSKAKKAVRKSTIEAYEALKLTAANGELVITGSSSIMTVVAKLKGEGEDSFACAVNANLLMTSIQKIVAEELILIKADGVLKIKGNKTKIVLPLLDITAFHDKDISNDVFVYEIDAEELPEYINNCSHALKSPAMDPRMESFNIEFGNGVKITATDGKRIAVRDSLNGTPNDNLIVHGKPLGEALRMMDGEIKISVPESKTYIKLQDDNVLTVINTIEGVYFNVNSLIDIEPLILIKINREELMAAVDVASLFGKPIFTIKEDGITVTCTQNCGGSEIEIPSVVTGLEKSLKICLDAGYLLDSLKSVESEFVTLGVINERSPVKIATDDESVSEIIMPVII